MNPSSDEVFLTLTDLKRLFFRLLPKIKNIALIVGCATCLFLFLKEPLFEARATFKMGGGASDGNLKFKEIFHAVGLGSKESAPIPTFLSKMVFVDAMEEMGLQVAAPPRFFLIKWTQRIWNNLKLELGKKVAPRDSFAFSNVKYEREEGLSFYIRLLDESHFEVLDQDKTVMTSGELNRRVAFSSFEGILKKMPSWVSFQNCYPLYVASQEATFSQLRAAFSIKPSKLNSDILELSFKHGDRHFSAQFVNQMMSSYQKMVKQENDKRLNNQIVYLKNKEAQLVENWNEILKEYEEYLKQNLNATGYFNFSQKMDLLSEPQNAFASKLFDLDIDLKRMESPQEFKVSKARDGESAEKPIRTGMHQEQTGSVVLELKRKELDEKLSQLNVSQHKAVVSEVDLDLKGIKAKIIQLDQQSKNIVLILNKVRGQEEIPSDLLLFFDAKSVVRSWVKQIVRFQEMEKDPSLLEKNKTDLETVALKKEKLSTQLLSFVTHLDESKHALEENLNWENNNTFEYASLDLDTARKLYTDYNNQRDALNVQLRQLIFLSEEIYNPNCEMSSLTTMTSDPVTHEMINKAASFTIQMRDENNRSLREKEHLQEAFETQKKSINHHLNHTIELTKLRIKLIEDKILSLQHTTVTLLMQEKELIQQKMKEISKKMSDLPEKWRLENLLLFKKEKNMRLMEAVSQLSESRQMELNIFQLDSKPLDAAVVPMSPKPSRFIAYALIFAFLSCSIFYFSHLFRALFSGLPVTHETLFLCGFNTLGTLSKNANVSLDELQKTDLETMRHVSHFLFSLHSKECLSCAIIGGKTPDFSKGLASLMALQGLKVLVVDYVFNEVVKASDGSGLWSYLKGESATLPIRKLDKYDYLPNCGTDRHGVEMIKHPQFALFLSQVKPHYDRIVIYTKADPKCIEGQSYFDVVDALIVATSQETRKEIAPYQALSEKLNQNNVAFVSFEGGCK